MRNSKKGRRVRNGLVVSVSRSFLPPVSVVGKLDLWKTRVLRMN